MKGRGVPLLFKLQKMTACSEWTKKTNYTFLTHHYTTPKNHGRGMYMASKKELRTRKSSVV